MNMMERLESIVKEFWKEKKEQDKKVIEQIISRLKQWKEYHDCERVSFPERTQNPVADEVADNLYHARLFLYNKLNLSFLDKELLEAYEKTLRLKAEKQERERFQKYLIL